MSQPVKTDKPSLQINQPQIASTRFSASAPLDSSSDHVLVSVVMPCLNEARTLSACIEQAHIGCCAALAQRAAIAQRAALAVRSETSPSRLREGREERAGRVLGDHQQTFSAPPTYEIVIADNGSTDGSQTIAIEHGARVVSVEQKGYGAALLGGIAAARGKYIVMGDSDCSYDFGEVPRFLDKLEEGFELVMGNRFAGGIEPGAMPWHHRYIGNPVLSGLGRLLYRSPICDWHCGLRAFERLAINDLHLTSPGMEFASELVLRAAQANLSNTQLPIVLRRDGRVASPHLRSFRDGIRHLMVLMLNCKILNYKSAEPIS